MATTLFAKFRFSINLPFFEYVVCEYDSFLDWILYWRQYSVIEEILDLHHLLDLYLFGKYELFRSRIFFSWKAVRHLMEFEYQSAICTAKHQVKPLLGDKSPEPTTIDSCDSWKLKLFDCQI